MQTCARLALHDFAAYLQIVRQARSYQVVADAEPGTVFVSLDRL